MERCAWVPENDPLYIQYHDEEWGVPLHDDRKLFEFLTLESFQAGLSWKTILYKRENFRKAFENFDVNKIAGWGEKEFNRLINDPGIVRNKLKISAAMDNAGAFLKIREEFGSFDHYMWKFVNFKPIQNTWTALNEMPGKTALSDLISADLKKRGFKFMGSTVVYAHMQATGMVNDHTINCFRYHEVKIKEL